MSNSNDPFQAIVDAMASMPKSKINTRGNFIEYIVKEHVPERIKGKQVAFAVNTDTHTHFIVHPNIEEEFKKTVRSAGMIPLNTSKTVGT